MNEATDKLCPLCDTNLEPRYINLKQALLVCPRRVCPYPVKGGRCILIDTTNKPLFKIDKKIVKDEGDRSLIKDKKKDSNNEINNTSSSLNCMDFDLKEDDVRDCLIEEIMTDLNTDEFQYDTDNESLDDLLNALY